MKLFASALVGILLVSCASTSYVNDKVRQTQADLRGMVYDLDRIPVAQAQVRLRGTDKSTTTDIHGHFLLPNVAFGTVDIDLEKVEYEPFHWKVDFGESSQVIYVQMADSAQLFDAAADAIDLRQWELSSSLLARAKTLEPDSPKAPLLEALVARNQGRFSDATAILEGFLLKWPRYPLLELAVADIYEADLKDSKRALLHLEAVQALRYDPEVDLRIRALRAVQESVN